MKKYQIQFAVILIFATIFLAGNVDAYTFDMDDGSDYSVAWHSGSGWAFSYVSESTDTGEMTLLGSSIWNAVHVCHVYVAMEFTTPGDGSGYACCSAIWTSSWKLIAGTAAGAFSKLTVNYVLFNSARTSKLASLPIFYAEAVCTQTGVWDIEYGYTTKSHSQSVQWSYSLQSSTTYYAAVEVYVQLYNGGYAFSAAGGVGDPTVMSLDVGEIRVFSA